MGLAGSILAREPQFRLVAVFFLDHGLSHLHSKPNGPWTGLELTDGKVNNMSMRRMVGVSGSLLTWADIYRIGQDQRIIHSPMAGHVANVLAVDGNNKILIRRGFTH